MHEIQSRTVSDFVDPYTDRVLDYLEHHLPGYPFLKSTDVLFVQELQRDFPELDILEEIKTFRWYFDDLASKKTHRAALRRWISRSKDWRR
jgi:hypothetical protein